MNFAHFVKAGRGTEGLCEYHTEGQAIVNHLQDATAICHRLLFAGLNMQSKQKGLGRKAVEMIQRSYIKNSGEFEDRVERSFGFSLHDLLF